MKRIKDLAVFVVDDNPLTRSVYQQCLSRLGCEIVHSFDNGQSCLDALANTPADLVLVDYLMEPMNGLELTKKIRRMTPQCYVVMISSQSDLQVAVNAIKYGAFDYITKGKSENDQIAGVLQKMLFALNLVKRGRPRKLNISAAAATMISLPPSLR
ncbi:MAG: response regulator [Bacteroidetes bacterium]|nr:response regulator [Bacteroidota bacterium]